MNVESQVHMKGANLLTCFPLNFCRKVLKQSDSAAILLQAFWGRQTS